MEKNISAVSLLVSQLLYKELELEGVCVWGGGVVDFWFCLLFVPGNTKQFSAPLNHQVQLHVWLRMPLGT